MVHEMIRPTMNKLDKYSQQTVARRGTQLGISTSSSSWQTRMASRVAHVSTL